MTATTLRVATPTDALRLSVLAMQVYLDTYATQGIHDGLARDVLETFTPRRFGTWLGDPTSQLIVAEQGRHLVGFAHAVQGAMHEHVHSDRPCELLRLYVQEPFTGQGMGRQLIAEAEATARSHGATTLWLTLSSGRATPARWAFTRRAATLTSAQPST
ncbi:MAG: GNAT family N-acetyltransferase [Proteobacteria bacterium]|nr:GNAT family N-acetyltransferase [Pseudomonadota bacterium]